MKNLIILVCALLISACASTTPERQDFLISAERQTARNEAKFGALQVNELRSNAPYRDLALIYKESPQRFVADPYHGFLAAPANQLTQQTRAWLAKSGLFSRVYPTGSSQIAPWQLEGELLAMYIDVSAPKTPKVVIQAQYLLSYGNKSANFLLTAEQSITDPGPESAAQGFSTALAKLLTQLEQELTSSNLD
ncbi:hypothetical protein NT239_05655 [Chitinibacter sp. SCUT-21]|uniref:ABC-type transport auxiliary lipoprotein family protein n=1 Tax=Chitinibacter sp. SCUT-21 TaxID=2970891 RepID=UPI0035A59DBA